MALLTMSRISHRIVQFSANDRSISSEFEEIFNRFFETVATISVRFEYPRAENPFILVDEACMNRAVERMILK